MLQGGVSRPFLQLLTAVAAVGNRFVGVGLWSGKDKLEAAFKKKGTIKLNVKLTIWPLFKRRLHLRDLVGEPKLRRHGDDVVVGFAERKLCL